LDDVFDWSKVIENDFQIQDSAEYSHGENERWLRKLDERAAAVRARAAFRRVEVATLREDWPDKREAAERHVRAIVERAAADGGRAIVIPFRVHGFGPYADVLAGLDYVADEQGLIPHSEVGRWIEAQVVALETGPFAPQVPRGGLFAIHSVREHQTAASHAAFRLRELG
jgi:hypothetical protein